MKLKEALRQMKRIDGNMSREQNQRYAELEEALNELERLKKFKETFDNYELAKKQDFIAYENWLECERELEELKRDVARYFELANVGDVTKEVLDEFIKIRDKILTVGKEDE